jgi:hypothetical protein
MAWTVYGGSESDQTYWYNPETGESAIGQSGDYRPPNEWYGTQYYQAPTLTWDQVVAKYPNLAGASPEVQQAILADPSILDKQMAWNSSWVPSGGEYNEWTGEQPISPPMDTSMIPDGYEITTIGDAAGGGGTVSYSPEYGAGTQIVDGYLVSPTSEKTFTEEKNPGEALIQAGLMAGLGGLTGGFGLTELLGGGEALLGTVDPVTAYDAAAGTSLFGGGTGTVAGTTGTLADVLTPVDYGSEFGPMDTTPSNFTDYAPEFGPMDTTTTPTAPVDYGPEFGPMDTTTTPTAPVDYGPEFGPMDTTTPPTTPTVPPVAPSPTDATKTPSWQKILNGTATAADWLSVLGTAAPGLLAAYASNQQADAIKDAAAQQQARYDEFKAMGAPYRTRLSDLFKDPNAFLSSPEVRTPVDLATQSWSRALSAKHGNPIESMTALGELQDRSSNLLFSRLGEEKDRLAGFGGLSAYNSAGASGNTLAATLAGINAGGGVWGGLGRAAGDVFNPAPDYWKQLTGGIFNTKT